MMGSLYFVGFAISAGIVTPLADIYGRKVIVLWSMVIQLLAYIAIIYSTNIYAVITYYFIIGMCAGGRECVGTVYFNEFFPSKHQNMGTSLSNAVDGSVMIW